MQMVQWYNGTLVFSTTQFAYRVRCFEPLFEVFRPKAYYFQDFFGGHACDTPSNKHADTRLSYQEKNEALLTKDLKIKLTYL